MKMGWLGFWIFMCVYALCEVYLYSNGHDTAFWQHKTEAEKQIQQQSIKDCK